MKKWILCLPCLAAALFRVGDLLLFCDVNGGYVQFGSVWLRYGSMLAFAVFVGVFASRFVKDDKHAPDFTSVHPVWPMLCGIGFAAAGVFQVLAGIAKVSVFNLLLGAALLVTAVNLAAESIGSRKTNIFRETAGMAGLYLLLIYRFAVQAASLQRTNASVQVISAVAAVWFACGVLRAKYLPDEPGTRNLCVGGVLAFLMCTCLEGSQTLTCAVLGEMTMAELVTGISMLIYGFYGIFSAFQCFDYSEKRIYRLNKNSRK